MNNIDNLLNSYFEGTTSPEEEKALKKHFQSDHVEPQHQMYKPLFAAFEKEKQIEAPAFEIPVAKSGKKQLLSRNFFIVAASAAAVVLLAVTLFPLKNKTTAEQDYVVFINGKEVTNPKKAQQYADKMFMQADKIVRDSYKPFIEAGDMENEMNADKIFNDLSKKINDIESIIQ